MKGASMLQLDIEPCIQRPESKIMSSLDWRRPALEILLKLYREHPMLYDMRHSKYYNKTERQKALNTIIDLLEDHRPGTTTHEILKKIQTLRTQFGQEISKMRKLQNKGIAYTPSVWWYKHLAFLRSHIKPRSLDDDEDYNVSISQQQEGGEYVSYTGEDSCDYENDGQSEIVYEIQSTPASKGPKIEFNSDTKLYRKGGTPVTQLNGSTKDEIIYEITQGNTLVPKRKLELMPAAESTPKHARNESALEENLSISQVNSVRKAEVIELAVDSDRSRSIGHFVSSQMASIKDDFLFYKTQMEVLNIINNAQLKQLQIDQGNKTC
ncbi:uncharacterized protein LOC131684128 [Topomyia yanbarensis]|uniref:uncharacterized protein LOC131684128 n=1 Tax=Topomyia yanbarensis TaxID=2498891 RepID=UPI00273C202B|nr:uncharacterized protein LOC131684128 [Topomyia yanbarensis]XP_058822687.1 uncharacterized protein LOC131684128 [Topomyia yanbarensis]